jgi:alcohol dehydrogenase class IV
LNHLEKAVAKDVSDLEQMAIASAMMGINLALSSTCLPHRLQYALGPHTKTSHAQGLIMLYRGWLPLISKTREFDMLESALGFCRGELVSRIEELKQRLEIDYRASDFGLTASDIPLLLDKVEGIFDADPCYVSKQTLENIMKGSL